jgi:16S rRNA (guanine527-N7)-methyltransferase
MSIIEKYFPALTDEQREQFERMGALYARWNAQINLISRPDVKNLYERHVLHSLAIAKFIRFVEGTQVMDAGTGGGFPGVPLAVLFPAVRFHLVDSVGKKVNAARSIAEELGLKNVTAAYSRLEDVKEEFDFVVSRAVMTMPELVRLVKKNIIRSPQRNALPNGFISLKGGDLNKELIRFGKNCILTNLSEYFFEEFFLTKKIVYIPI